MKTITITFTANHDESSHAQLSLALARFSRKTLRPLGYDVVSIKKREVPFELPGEKPKVQSEDKATTTGDVTHYPTKDVPKTVARELIEPGNYTIKELRDFALSPFSKRQLGYIHNREMKDEARDGAIAAIKDAVDQL